MLKDTLKLPEVSTFRKMAPLHHESGLRFVLKYLPYHFMVQIQMTYRNHETTSSSEESGRFSGRMKKEKKPVSSSTRKQVVRAVTAKFHQICVCTNTEPELFQVQSMCLPPLCYGSVSDQAGKNRQQDRGDFRSALRRSAFSNFR